MIPAQDLITLLDSVIGADYLRAHADRPAFTLEHWSPPSCGVASITELDAQDLATLTRIASGEAYEIMPRGGAR